MNTRWDSTVGIGLVHFMAFPQCIRGEGPILETVTRLAEDDFFSVVEITHISDPQVRRQVKSVLDSAHMHVGFAGQPLILLNNLNPNSLDDGEWQKALEFLKNGVDEAYELGAKMMAIMSGPYPGEAQKPKAMDKLTESCIALCRYAKERARDYELTISFEAFDRDVDKKALIGPSPDARQLAERVRSEVDNFGLCVDLSHLPLLQESPQDCFAELGEHLIHVHAGNCVKDKNSPLYGDQHPRFGYPGGENDVEELRVFLETLFYSGYFQRKLPTPLPVLSFEVKPTAEESSQLIIANTKRVFKEAWAKAGAG